MPGRSNGKKGGGARWQKGAILLLLVAGLVFVFREPLAVLAFVLTGGSMSMTEAVDNRPLGYFYRFTARYSHKGEPLVFDYVVACNIRITSYRGGDRSDDSTYAPKVMMLPTKSGSAVMVRTIAACNGQTTENGRVPADLFPMAIWFDDVNDMTFGWGYATWDAYESELSQLEFHEARISPATRADWEAWREASAKDFEPVGMIKTPWGLTYNEPGYGRTPVLARSCFGYSRLEIPDNIRASIQELRPASQPRFWYPVPDKSRETDILKRGQYPSGKEFKKHVTSGTLLYAGAYGLPRWGGNGTLYSWIEDKVPHDVFPLMPTSRSVTTPVDPRAEIYPHNLLNDEHKNKGFVACGGGALIDRAPHRFDPEFARKPKPVFVEGIRTVGPHRTWGAPAFIFDRDKYVYIIGPAGTGAP
ncbi:MAG: hypothetical protein AAGL24_27985 [Pseudomonadota bacterium]